MCTVVYIPQNEGVLLCSVRDESPTRKRALAPEIFHKNGRSYLCPLDGEHKGTWVGTNDRSEVIILLNGAFKNHLPNNRTYRKSRGLIVKELIAEGEILLGWEHIDLTDIEPFTLIVYSKTELKELIWDGEEKHAFNYENDESHIWSSSTLYSPVAKTERINRFKAWKHESALENKKDVIDFINSFQDPEIGFIMNRSSIVQSLSISIIEVNAGVTHFNYKDLLSGEESEQTLHNEDAG